MFITTTTVIYSLGHGLRTLPAVPKSTQPYTLRGTRKMRSIRFRLRNNNNWRWWMWMVAAIYRRNHSQAGWIGWVGGSVCNHHMNEQKSHDGFSHDDSTINFTAALLLLLLLTHRTVDGRFKHIHSTRLQSKTNCLTMNTTSYQCQQNSQCY